MNTLFIPNSVASVHLNCFPERVCAQYSKIFGGAKVIYPVERDGARYVQVEGFISYKELEEYYNCFANDRAILYEEPVKPVVSNPIVSKPVVVEEDYW